MTLIVAWLWQGLAIAWLTTIVLRGMSRVSAATRYAIWWLALAAVVALPIATASSPHAEEPIASAVVVAPAVASWIVSSVIAIWALTVIAGAVRLGAAVHRVARLRRDSRPFDAEREARLTMWMSVREARRRPALRIADMASGACALGLARPAIVVSRRVADALDAAAVDQIVMHEHAHLMRFDDWSRLAQVIIACVVGLHPAVRFITRQIDLEREAACDDLVVSRTGAAKQYAVCLADAAAISIGAFDATLAPSAIGSSSMLTARVARLLDPRRLRASRPAIGCCAAAVLGFAAFVFVSRDFTPIVTAMASRAATVLDSAELRWTGRFDVPDNSVPLSPKRAKPVVKRARRTNNGPLPATTSPALQARTVDVDTTTAPLDSRPLEHSYHAPASTPYSARPPDAAPWTRTANAGIAIGSSAKRSGVAIGGFFTRAGKAIGKNF